jgi:hypothetical protein
MARSSWLRALTRRDHHGAPQRPVRRRRAAPLALEPLEDRRLPTVVFTPAFGAETLQKTPNNDYNFQTLSSPTVELIFWGKYWGQHKNQVSSLTTEALFTLASPYLKGLTEYGSTGGAAFGNWWIDTSSNSNSNGNSNSAIQTEIANAINKSNGTIAAPPSGATQLTAPIYVVIGDPNNSPGNGGFNVNGTYTPSGGSAIPINMVFAGTGGGAAGIDVFTFGLTFSHEMAERMTDPTNDTNGVEVSPPPNLPANLQITGTPQIGDFEPEPNGQSHYSYRVGAVGLSAAAVVQPFWSNADQAFIVPDGNSQTVTLNPLWTIDSQGNANFSNQYDLTVTGDQGGVRDDAITIDGTASGTTIVLNSESFAFDGGRIRNITINPGGGRNTVNVQEVDASQAVSVDSTSADAVTIGKNGTLAGLLGKLSVLNGGGARVFLTLDDSRDGTRRLVTQDQGSIVGFYTITGTRLGTVLYAGDALSALTIDGGTAADTFDLLVTAPYLTTTLDTGYGSDNVNVRATSGPLVITSTAAHPATGQAQNAVLLGSRAPSLGGSLQGLFGPVSVSNTAGSTSLTVNDSADQSALNYTLTDSSLTNDYYLGAPAAINYGHGVSTLVVHAGNGANTFHVLATGPATTLDAGSGTSAVTVGDAGHNLLFVGALTVNGNGKTALTMDDRGNGPAPTGFPGYSPVLTQYLVQSGSLTRSALASVILPDVGPTVLGFTSVIKYRGLSGVTIDGGPLGPYTYQIDSTGGSGGATVNAGSTLDVVTAGDAQNNLRDVRSLAVNGNGHTLLTVDDTGNVLGALGASVYIPQLTQFTVQSFALTCAATALVIPPGGLPAAQLFSSKVSFQGLSGLTIDGGPSAPNLYQIDSTVGVDSVTVNAGGQDALTVGDSRHNLKDVGSLKVNGNGSTSLVVDDTGNRSAITASSIYVPELTQFFVQSGSSQQPPSGTLTRLATALANLAPGLPPTTRVFPSTITYQGVSGLMIDGGHATPNLYQIDSTAGTGAGGVSVTAGGDDSVTVGEASGGTLDAITAVTVNGNGSTVLTLNDPGAAVRENYLVYTGKITRGPITSPPTEPTQIVTYSGLASITLNGADASGNVFYAVGTPAGMSLSLNAGSGGFNAFIATDEYSPSDTSPGTDQLLGPVAFHGHHTSDFGERYDYYDGAGHTFTFSAAGAVSTVQRDGAADLTYDGLSQMIVYVPKGGGNRLNVVSVAPGVFMNLTQSAGDQAVVGSLAPALGGTTANILGTVAFGDEVLGVTSAVTVDDSGDTSTAARLVTVSPPPANPDDPDSSAVGLLGAPSLGVYWRLNPGSSVALRGGAGDTTFALQGALPDVSLSIVGGGGVNALDYSGWTGDVAVNLQLGTATGVDGGISNIRNVTGSIGNDLIVGDANANVLSGGTGRNVIIGGGGADQITGGGGDNLLIGGTTDFDQNAAALDLIMQEWLLPSDFTARIAALQTGGDLLSGSGIQLDSTTVHTDGQSNVTPGPGNNWVIP